MKELMIEVPAHVEREINETAKRIGSGKDKLVAFLLAGCLKKKRSSSQ